MLIYLRKMGSFCKIAILLTEKHYNHMIGETYVLSSKKVSNVFSDK
jgi:hypothetical protein